MRITMRDVVVATSTAVLVLAGSSVARSAPGIMTSTIFHWGEMQASATATGQVRQVFRTPTGTLDELECHVTTLSPSQASHAPHTHPNEEVLIVREGNVEVFYKGDWHPATVGDVIFLTGTDPHGIRNAGTTPATYHVLSWHSPGMLKASTESGE
jgi:XRE family transcriptional regulator, regulator of sulfur utilization